MEKNLDKALEAVLDEMEKLGPKDPFSQKVMLAVLKMIPAAPKLPGLSVFCEVSSKVVPYFIDFAIIRKTISGKEVFLAYRDDQHYKGWHFPGFMRLPRVGLLENCQSAADRELGGLTITGLKLIYNGDVVDDPRFHVVSALHQVEFTGEPFCVDGCKGGWFSEMPADIIPTHKEHWRNMVHLIA